MAQITLSLRQNLNISEQESDDGCTYVVKDPQTEHFFRFQEYEYFLLQLLDGSWKPEQILEKFEKAFSAPLSPEEFGNFLLSLDQRGLLQKVADLEQVRNYEVIGRQDSPEGAKILLKNKSDNVVYQFSELEYLIIKLHEESLSPQIIKEKVKEKFNKKIRTQDIIDMHTRLRENGLVASRRAIKARLSDKVEAIKKRSRLRGNMLYIRYMLSDPTDLLDHLHDKTRMFFSQSFLYLSSLMITLGIYLIFNNLDVLVYDAMQLMSFSTLFLVWLVVIPMTVIHEFAHGVTCRHFGGKVPEMGVMLIFFQPAMYCNVSDAWRFKERYKRIWVGMAGVYFEMFLWSMAVIVWYLSAPELFLHKMALILVGASGFRCFINLIPFIKLDGYYVLSDVLNIPNLRSKSINYLRSIFSLKWLLGKDDGKDISTRERTIYVLYGITASVFSFFLLGFILLKLGEYLTEKLHGTGFIIFMVMILTLMGVPVFRKKMAKNPAKKKRRSRIAPLAKFAILLTSLTVIIGYGQMDLKIGGEFAIYPANHAEIRASTGGIVEQVLAREGQLMQKGDLVASISDRVLEQNIADIDAEMNENSAREEKVLEMIRHSKRRLKDLGKLGKQKAISKTSYQDAETDLVIRRKELKETEAELARLKGRRAHLVKQQDLLKVTSPIRGVVTTPKPENMIGQYIQQGDMLVEIYQNHKVRAEIYVSEKDISDVKIGQDVLLKVRAYPGKEFTGKVTYIAPMVEEVENSPVGKAVRVHTEIDNETALLKKEMTGYAKIFCGEYQIYELLMRKIVRFFKVEFWSWW